MIGLLIVSHPGSSSRCLAHACVGGADGGNIRPGVDITIMVLPCEKVLVYIIVLIALSVLVSGIKSDTHFASGTMAVVYNLIPPPHPHHQRGLG